MSVRSMERSFPKITENGLDELRKRIGVKIGVTAEPWCYEATRDNIRHYAHGIGDDNPLWCVPEYAAKTKYGDVIALPSFLFATSRIVSGYVGGLPGVRSVQPEEGHRVRIFYDPAQDPTDAVVRLAADAGWGLHEIAPEKLSLEELFVELTASTGNTTQEAAA